MGKEEMKLKMTNYQRGSGLPRPRLAKQGGLPAKIERGKALRCPNYCE